MAYITGKVTQGCCMPVRYENGIYECEPDVGEFFRRHRIYNDYHFFFAKVVGEVGEKLTVRLHWPAYDPDAISDEYKAWKSYSDKWGTFAIVLDKIIYHSTDNMHWSRIEQVEREDENTVLFTLTLTSEISYISTLLRYTPTAYEALEKALAASPVAERISLGKGWDGDELATFVLTDPAVDNSSKKTVYIHGVQHCNEHPGAHVSDYMLRYLISDDATAKDLLRRYIFRITPIVDKAGWRLGAEVHPARRGTIDFNPNRDWGLNTLPEIRAITAYLDELKAKGEKFALFCDLHGGGGSMDLSISGPNGIFFDLDGSAEDLNARARFIRMVREYCDYMSPADDTFWPVRELPCQFAKFAETRYGAHGFAFEIAQVAMWDKAAGRRLFNSQEGYRRFAEQLVSVIDRYLTAEE